MPYIKRAERAFLDQVIDNLVQATEGDDGKLNYAISRLVARSYAPWKYSSIQRAVGLLSCVAQEFYARVARPYEEEAEARNGDIAEYEQADEAIYYLGLARHVVSYFPASGTFDRSAFDSFIANSPILDRQGPGFTDQLHKDGYIVMGTKTVTLGVKGIELAKHRH
jgi:hypothetical protein